MRLNKLNEGEQSIFAGELLAATITFLLYEMKLYIFFSSQLTGLYRPMVLITGNRLPSISSRASMPYHTCLVCGSNNGISFLLRCQLMWCSNSAVASENGF